MKSQYKRILLKISGEGLAGDGKNGIDAGVAVSVAKQIAALRKNGTEVCLVIGGGNFFRGGTCGLPVDRSDADHAGMLATVMNALIFKSVLESLDTPAEVFSALDMPQVCSLYTYDAASLALRCGKTVIFAAGTGNPYFTTDTGAVLRAAEMHCDIMLKATQVDGVYDADPRMHPEAKRYDVITYAEVLQKRLKVLDMTAAALAEDVNLPVMIFAMRGENSVVNAVNGTEKCTVIKK